jgi:hypothetical protein
MTPNDIICQKGGAPQVLHAQKVNQAFPLFPRLGASLPHYELCQHPGAYEGIDEASTLIDI